MKSEYDVQSTFEGDNNVLMQQVGKVYYFFIIMKCTKQRMDMLVSDFWLVWEGDLKIKQNKQRDMVHGLWGIAYVLICLNGW